MVLSLESPQQLQQWNSVWHQCQQTKQQLEETLARSTTAEPNSTSADESDVLKTPESQTVSPEQRGANRCVRLPVSITPLTFEDSKNDSPVPFSKSPTSSISSMSHFTFSPDSDSKLRQSPSMFDDTDSDLQHIMDEMISTEREYVRSLSYIIEHYFPEMERLDLPQDLRGKRSIIFGNVEKLWDFHSQYFLKELEACAHSPLSISSCFLRHEDQFGMYALYSKNKPQSDALLCSHGNEFFKQMELGDKMDLASYLLKPIQRMSKYALLLKDLIKECSQSQEQELNDLRTAEEMVKFQLRHGNDLLAMDAIRGCDVSRITQILFDFSQVCGVYI
uniref:DH domain-containing protein n=1 Tax=Amphiprion percula TaxID=161767 RepID=A0A3P8SMQ8_AMPPE